MGSTFDIKRMPARSAWFSYGIHLLIWGSLLFIPLIFFHNAADSTGLPGNFFFFANIYHIALFYINAYFLYPRLFTRNLWWLYLLILSAIMAGSYYAKLTLLNWFYPGMVLTEYNNRIIFFPPIAFLIAGVLYRLVKDRVELERREKENRAERLVSELKFLRSQISPHFLFNMMTNMISLARKKSDLLEPSLLKLSDLLRYMLYESGKEKFLISDEILYLKSYVELQQMRFGEDTDLQLEIRGDNSGCHIEPMLLVPFVENAFKHGIGTVENPFIKIVIEIKEDHLSFSVSNNYNAGNLSKDKSSGIGLENVKNRLELLYPGKYKLDLNDSGSIYTVKLNLTLTC
jgi:two-component system LytT family sensor kinase